MSPRSSMFVVAGLAVVAAHWLPQVAAQATTDAECSIRSYDWTFNSKNQSPCLIAAYAQAPCHDGDWNVPELGSGEYYVGPRNPDQATPCTCSTPVWSLLMACSYCQNGTTFTDWPAWSTNCSTVYTTYPQPISPSTSIPAWAYIRVPADGQWDPTLAFAADSGLESTATNVPSTATALPTSSSTSAALTSLTRGTTRSTSTRFSTTTPRDPSSTSNASSGGGGGGGSNTGAIAGGVVGGVVGLAAIALIAFFLAKRRRERKAAVSGAPTSATPYDPPSMAQTTPYSPPSTTAPMMAGYATSPGPSQEARLYNPNDPTTFPQAMTGSPPPSGSFPSPAPPEGSLYSGYSAQYQQPQGANPFQTPLSTPGMPPNQQFQPNRGGYSGAPEV